jgi:minor histocompatibility antigen H13
MPVPVAVQQNLLTVFILTVSCWAAARTPSTEREAAMTSSDAAQMPFVAGGALLALYGAFRFLDAAWVNFVLRAYFVVSGALAVAHCAAPLAAALLPRARPLCTLPVWRLPDLPEWAGGPKRGAPPPPPPAPWRPTAADALAHAAGALVAGWYAVGDAAIFGVAVPRWASNNALGVAFCVSAIGLLNPGSFKTAALLQAALFVYDIAAVFGTGAALGPHRVSIMEEVAVRLDGPIKIFFPAPDAAARGGRGMALLGLGDIIVPGTLLALLLRFDAARAAARGGRVGAPFSAPYFNAGVLAYVGGLALTSLALALADTAQPALLYLVPALLCATLGVAAARGEVALLWAYDEEAAPTAAARGGGAPVEARPPPEGVTAATRAAPAAETKKEK